MSARAIRSRRWPSRVLVERCPIGCPASTTSTSPARSCFTPIFALGLNVLVGYARPGFARPRRIYSASTAYAAGYMLAAWLTAIRLAIIVRAGDRHWRSMAIYAASVAALRPASASS
mgnify:CR=1 FL=1